MSTYILRQGQDARLGNITVDSIVVSANHLEVEVDLSEETWNTVASHEIATVTGLVQVQLIAQVTTTGDDTSGDTSNIQLGVEGATDNLIAATDVDDLLAGELWYDATPTTAIDTPANVALERIINGLDIGYEITGEAATAGVIVFHIFWVPISDGATVAAGAGGTL